MYLCVIYFYLSQSATLARPTTCRCTRVAASADDRFPQLPPRIASSSSSWGLSLSLSLSLSEPVNSTTILHLIPINVLFNLNIHQSCIYHDCHHTSDKSTVIVATTTITTTTTTTTTMGLSYMYYCNSKLVKRMKKKSRGVWGKNKSFILPPRTKDSYISYNILGWDRCTARNSVCCV